MEILSNKSYRQYTKISRYSPFPYYYHKKDDKYIYGKTSYLRDDTLFTTYVVKRNDTLDSIALEFYNNPTLYWIICSFNIIQDPFKQLKEGQKLKIPALSNIEFKR